MLKSTLKPLLDWRKLEDIYGLCLSLNQLVIVGISITRISAFVVLFGVCVGVIYAEYED